MMNTPDPMSARCASFRFRAATPLHDQMIGAMRRRRQQRAADQYAPECYVLVSENEKSNAVSYPRPARPKRRHTALCVATIRLRCAEQIDATE